MLLLLSITRWSATSLPVFFFNDTATTEIYTLSLTTLFRSLAELLAGFGSGVVEVAVAVLVISVPSASVGLTWDRKGTRLNSRTTRTPDADLCLEEKLQPPAGRSPGACPWARRCCSAVPAYS